MSSRSPGCSPTSITLAWAAPSPITPWVAPSDRSQARHSCTALRMLAWVGRAGIGGGGRSATVVIRRMAYPGDEAGTHRLFWLAVRRLAGPLLPAEGAPAAPARAIRREIRPRRGPLDLLPP